jgi:hypothetical protein
MFDLKKLNGLKFQEQYHVEIRQMAHSDISEEYRLLRRYAVWFL